MDLIIERLPPKQLPDALMLVNEVFSKEQDIPVSLHDLDESLSPIWWSARINSDIVGVVAGWIEEGQWHWGRFAVKKSLRGFGIGKKLAVFSLNDIFSLGADKITIGARDVTVGILGQLGGKVVGEPTIFYGGTVTPMILTSYDFVLSKR